MAFNLYNYYKLRLIEYISIYSKIYWKPKSFLQFDAHASNIKNRRAHFLFTMIVERGEKNLTPANQQMVQ